VTATESTISQFAPISLAEMDGVKLQNRVDTKYVFAEGALVGFLAALREDYRVLEVDGQRGTRYRTLYLDTPGLMNFRDHHNRRTFRSKVRYREYVGSGLCFLEVKRKTGRGRTDKARLRVEGIPESPAEEHLRFIADSGVAHGPMRPALWNHFLRYTFVRSNGAERLTLDIGLQYSLPGREQGLGGLVVAELKQARMDRMSPFARLMRSAGIRPSGMSKYCVGILMLGQPVKHNAFKPVMLMLERVRNAA